MSTRKLITIIILSIAAAVAAASISCSTSQTADWGLQAVDSMNTPSDPPLQCGASIPSLQNDAARSSCTFGAGSHAADTLGIAKDTLTNLPIRHVIIMMKENRSFDHLFGKLHDQGQPNTEAEPADYLNPDASGAPVAPFHATSTCIGFDPGHQADSMVEGIAGGAMNGFVKSAASTTGTDGHFVMSYYDQTDFPFYYWLANTYSLSDRHFAPMQSGTYGNRNFMMFGSNAGVVDTGIAYPNPDTLSIFRTLINAGYTWGAYSDSEPLSGTLGWSNQDPGVHTMQELYDALDAGKLPNVAFVDAIENVDDDHPPADIQAGEAALRKIYDHAVKSPQWQRLAIIWVYDEGGGFADHVPPPSACRATPDSPYKDLGVRVPLVAISPWAKRHYVSHVVHDHTAITRFVEAIFDLPALTARDANSDALLDLFDFSCGRDLTPPAGAPDPGTGGCAH